MNSTTGKSSSASVSFDLLNPGDEQSVEFIYTGTESLPTVNARIEGLSSIVVSNKYDPIARRRTGAAVFLYLSLIGSLIWLLASRLVIRNASDIFGAGVLFIVYAFIIWFGSILLIWLPIVYVLEWREKDRVPHRHREDAP